MYFLSHDFFWTYEKIPKDRFTLPTHITLFDDGPIGVRHTGLLSNYV